MLVREGDIFTRTRIHTCEHQNHKNINTSKPNTNPFFSKNAVRSSPDNGKSSRTSIQMLHSTQNRFRKQRSSIKFKILFSFLWGLDVRKRSLKQLWVKRVKTVHFPTVFDQNFQRNSDFLVLKFAFWTQNEGRGLIESRFRRTSRARTNF